jgi:hypothetical protein
MKLNRDYEVIIQLFKEFNNLGVCENQTLIQSIS